jgi:hypothetical protein
MSWVRFLPIPRPDVFALHRLWLADMPAPLHRAIGYLRLRSLDPTTAFEAAIDDIVAVRPEPVGDVEAALVARLEGLGGLPTVLVDVPENPGTQTPPFVLVTPWSLAPLDRVAAADEIVDNYTETGAFVRPATASLQLEYRIDVFADDRASKAQFLDAIVASILSDARLVVANVPLSLVPFVPPSEVAATIEPGRTPLFVRVTTQVETGPRNRRDFAVPFVVAGPADGRETAEAAAAGAQKGTHEHDRDQRHRNRGQRRSRDRRRANVGYRRRRQDSPRSDRPRDARVEPSTVRRPVRCARRALHGSVRGRGLLRERWA